MLTHTIYTPSPSTQIKKPISQLTISGSIYGTSVSVTKVSVSAMSYPGRFTNISNRYRRHQTCEHGRTNRGHHGDRIPPITLQFIHVLELKKQHQARRHARFRVVRSAIKMYVTHHSITLSCLYSSGIGHRFRRRRRPHHKILLL
jgi:hypothetical protein